MELLSGDVPEEFGDSANRFWYQFVQVPDFNAGHMDTILNLGLNDDLLRVLQLY